MGNALTGRQNNLYQNLKKDIQESTELKFIVSLLLESGVKLKEIVDNTYQPTGYNIGININPSAGQKIKHLHIHLIPRYDQDVEDPRG